MMMEINHSIDENGKARAQHNDACKQTDKTRQTDKTDKTDREGAGYNG